MKKKKKKRSFTWFTSSLVLQERKEGEKKKEKIRKPGPTGPGSPLSLWRTTDLRICDAGWQMGAEYLSKKKKGGGKICIIPHQGVQPVLTDLRERGRGKDGDLAPIEGKEEGGETTL